MKSLIDTKGSIHSADSRVLRQTLSADTLSTDDLAEYVVKNIGFIALARSASGLRIWWRPSACNHAAFLALHRIVEVGPEARTIIASFHETWRYEFFPSTKAALGIMTDRIIQRCNSKRVFEAKQRRLETIKQQSQLGRVIRFASENAKSIWQNDVREILHRLTGGKYILLHPRGSDNNLYIHAWGTGYRSFNEEWVKRAAGLRFEDQPDIEFARYSIGAYRTVASNQETRVEDIATTVWKPRRGEAQTSYTRLILPLKTTMGLMLLGTPVDAIILDGQI